MTRPTRLLVGMAFALAVGCQKSAEPAASNAADGTDAPTPQKWNMMSVGGIPYSLQPVPRDGDAPEKPAADVLAGLFPGMAKDAQTHELLTRFHGGAEVDFRVMLGADEAAVKAAIPEHPKKGDRKVYWIITGAKGEPRERDEDENTPGLSKCLSVSLGWDYKFFGVNGVRDEHEVLALAANEYLFRHNLGFRLKHGIFLGSTNYKPETRPLVELRKELNARIAEQLKATSPNR